MEKEIKNVNLEDNFSEKTEITKLAKPKNELAINLSKYKPEEIEKARPLANKIDTNNVNSISNFGVDLQNGLNGFSNEIINNNHKFTRNFFRLETYKNKKSIDFNVEGVFNIYNIVLENNCIGKRYPIRVNGILTESLSEYDYILNKQKKTKTR